MASRLKIVGTPLGNLDDISLRAINEIKQADLILAEDTRETLKLIKALGISLKTRCRLVSCDAHKELHRIDVVSERLMANEHVLLMSDAGCPSISDPGSLMVKGLLERGLDVEIIPGPSAHTAAIMGAGIDTTRFSFLGFLPKRVSARKDLILSSAEAGLALIIYESPLRISALLLELHALLGARRVVVARELTKIFETFHRGVLGSPLNPPLVSKGEFVVVVEAGKVERALDQKEETDITGFIAKGLSEHKSAKDIAFSLVERFKLKKKYAYSLVLRVQDEGFDNKGP